MVIPVFHIKYGGRAVRVVRGLMQDASKVCAVSDAIDVHCMAGLTMGLKNSWTRSLASRSSRKLPLWNGFGNPYANATRNNLI